MLDRNGLRPSRYCVTKDGLVVMASEAGVLKIPTRDIVSKGRLRPGRMFLVDTTQGRIITDDEIKNGLAARHPYREWIEQNQINLASLPGDHAARQRGARPAATRGRPPATASRTANTAIRC